MKNSYYTIPKCGLSVLLAAALMLCGAVVRIVYYTGVGASAGELWIQGALRRTSLRHHAPYLRQ